MKKIIPVTIVISILTGIISFSLYIGKRITNTSYFYSTSNITELISPDTFKINLRNNKSIIVTSYLIDTPKGTEGCKKAKKMSAKGYKIINNLLINAKTLRLEPMRTKQRNVATAKIFINEKRIGPILYKAGAAVKYKKGSTFCS
ncbi:MAG: hypothetical protein QM504_03470 [Pseudomonadota bacterium]